MPRVFVDGHSRDCTTRLHSTGFESVLGALKTNVGEGITSELAGGVAGRRPHFSMYR